MASNVPLAVPRLGLGKMPVSQPHRKTSLQAAPDNAPELIERIGKGAYGSVWSAHQHLQGKVQSVAVKIMPLPQDLQETTSLEKEINLMRTFDHGSPWLRVEHNLDSRPG